MIWPNEIRTYLDLKNMDYFTCERCSELEHDNYGKEFEINDYGTLNTCEGCKDFMIKQKMLIPDCEYSTKDKNGNVKHSSDWVEFKKTIYDGDLGYAIDGEWVDSLGELNYVDVEYWNMSNKYIQELIGEKMAEIDKTKDELEALRKLLD